MRLRTTGIILLGLSLTLLWGSGFAQEVPIEQEGAKKKRAQTGMKFTSISINPRAAALGDAVTAVELNSGSMFYNPAAMSRMEGFGHLTAGQVQWVADISYNAATLSLQPANGQYGVVGFSVRSVDYGDFERTRRAGNEAGYIEMGTYSPSGLELGLSYAQSVTDRFSVGGSVKYVHQNLGEGSLSLNNGGVESQTFDLSTPAFDFGVMYDPGIESLQFAMSARNFSPAIEFVEESFELPLTLNVGLSMDVLDLAPVGDTHGLLLSVDTAHPRDYSETISVGGEYSFQDILFLRGGITAPSDEEGINLGAGLHYGFGSLDLRADYSYSEMGLFGDVNRIAVGVGF